MRASFGYGVGFFAHRTYVQTALVETSVAAIVLWFVEDGRRDHRSLDRPWYKTAKQPSFAEMLRMIRRESLREEVFA